MQQIKSTVGNYTFHISTFNESIIYFFYFFENFFTRPIIQSRSFFLHPINHIVAKFANTVTVQDTKNCAIMLNFIKINTAKEIANVKQTTARLGSKTFIKNFITGKSIRFFKYPNLQNENIKLLKTLKITIQYGGKPILNKSQAIGTDKRETMKATI